jgi:hypothetical protein
MWYDVRHAIRSLRSAPTFTIVALIVLSLAIGASTAIFSVVDAVVLRGLPYDESDRLVQVATFDPRSGDYASYQPPQNFGDWSARQDVFAAMAATTDASGFRITANGVTRDLPTLQVTSGYVDVYRARPQIGRAFTAEHQIPGSQHVALISDGLWRRQFGADPGVIGRTLRSTEELTYGAPFPVPAGTWTIIGTTNMDNRSFEHNDEVNVALRDPVVTDRLCRAFASDLDASDEITLSIWRSRPLFEKIVGPLCWILERQQ